MRCLALAVLVACSSPGKPPAHVPPSLEKPAPPQVDVAPELGALREGAHVRGFTVDAVYLDDADQPIGAKLVHDKTGFTLEYLRIESAPQGYIWVKTYPTSDQGEPHTQEHLLLGKGERGRRLGSSEAMALAKSSAFTEQWHTAYHFHTVAGPDVYWSVFENQLDALLHPDYTDEEIRREVRNFGVDRGDKSGGGGAEVDKSGGSPTRSTAGGGAEVDDKQLHLEEKGTVYNEMVRAYEEPDVVADRAIAQLLYGAKHPLALESGGYPEAIRTMTPADIRKFHADHYVLANMGIIAAYPSSMSLASVLEHTAQILDKQHTAAPVIAELPKPAPAPVGTLAVVEFPSADAASEGRMELAWPATRALDATERVLLGVFVDALAGDETTPLYQKLIASKTRAIELGAEKLVAKVSSDLGQPVKIEITGVKGDKLDDHTLGEVRTIVMAEVARIAKLPDGDAELVAFDARVKSRLASKRKGFAKFLDSPPRFGERTTDLKWFIHLHDVEAIPGFTKSITMRPTFAAIDKLLAGTANPWRTRIATWGLDVAPYGVAAKPSPALRKQIDDARAKRISDELSRLAGVYKTTTPAATLGRFATDYDAATPAQQATELPPLVATPPMTLDDSLKYETGELGAVRTFTATFDSMQSTRVELSFDLANVVAPSDQMFLAALPELLVTAGVIDGQPISAPDMKDRLRTEVLELDARYIGDKRTLRTELAFMGQGLGDGETKNALAWIRRVMLAPDWRIENLPRLRDIVDQALTKNRTRMLDPEETWVENPRDAWWHQDALQAHTGSFLTKEFDLYRLRWMLEDLRDLKVMGEVFLPMKPLEQNGTRAELTARAKQLATVKASPAAQAVLRDVSHDLVALLAEIPDDSLAADWGFVVTQMARDLQVGAPAALAKLEAIRKAIVHAKRARIVETASTKSQRAIGGELQALVDAIPDVADVTVAPLPKGVLRARLRSRRSAKDPLFVGLYAPSTSSGVFLDLAPSTSFADDHDDQILDYLASNLYTGHGAHSIFMKTWAAGLAYSNGLHPHVADGTIDYYAERCPLLPQTIRFVIDQLRREQPDANIARYAVAGAFESRVADDYERRAAAMAANLVDGIPPDLVRAFRTHVLGLAKRDLAGELFSRLRKVYGKVLPGFGKPSADNVYFVIGNAKQLAAYQDYLHAAVDKTTTLFTLYPRDFWLP